jgi:hypothetical protein
MSVIPTPNERCRWLEMAEQLRRSRGFARGRRGKSTRLQFEANFRPSQRVPVSHLPQLWGTYLSAEALRRFAQCKTLGSGVFTVLREGADTPRLAELNFQQRTVNLAPKDPVS